MGYGDILEVICGVILEITYWGLGSLRRVYLYGWYNGLGSFDTLVGCGVTLEDTWCIIGGILGKTRCKTMSEKKFSDNLRL